MKPIAITLGDPAGIGPEIIAKAFRDGGAPMAGCFVAGDLECLRRARGPCAGARAACRSRDRAPRAFACRPACIALLQVIAPPAAVAAAQVGAARPRRGDCVVWAARAASARRGGARS
jgi:4-hydroxythreonine-4-phosphate dehydrogenase